MLAFLMKNNIQFALTICSLALTAGCGTSSSKQLSSGVFLQNFDRTVRPQDDLYRFVNGQWLAKTSIPADRSNYGMFTVLADKAKKDVRAIIDETAASLDTTESSSTDTYKIGALFKSAMDTDALVQRGLKPISVHLAKIEAITGKDDVVGYLASARRLGLPSPLVMYISPDSKAPTVYAAHLTQSGLGLPDRDYYLGGSDRYKALLAKYEEHIASMLELTKLVPEEAAPQAAKTIVTLETALATVQWTRTERRNRDKTYNPISPAELGKLAPAWNWNRYFEAAGMSTVERVIIRELSYVPALANILSKYSVDDWKQYLRWSLLRASADNLSPKIDEANFAFYGTALMGIMKQRPRWERAVDVVNGVLGEAVGKLYVARHFRPEAKQRMQALVENLRKAFGASLMALEWMSPETRTQALDKLKKFRPKIGYPDTFKDYSTLRITPDTLYENLQRAAQYEYDRRLAQLGGPVDKDEWFMTPQTVNAYYNPRGNEIVFPAAILQPPFFDLDADDAVNYGAIGAVIGHEMGHGFDDQGAKSDGDGVLRNWWTAADLEEFTRRTRMLVDQYAAYVVIDDLSLNGKFTLGENIGDLGGLSIAYRAYQMSLDGDSSTTLDGFTGEQRFFIGWAQCWPRLYRDEELRRRLVVDPHSPSEFRANGPVRNMQAFVEAFQVKAGDKLWLPAAERVSIW
ncbi:MAG: M13-type metalloendopeptidase [Myxococcota bacterium]|nr:M13-type metalloendopeptidase [Myxococcota bacterium]